MVGLADVHTHLTDKAFALDRAEVVERAKAAGVAVMITNGLNPADNRQALALASPSIKVALGCYPGDAVRLSDEAFAEELAWIKEQRCVAIGEIGLDGTLRGMPTQTRRFRALVRLAAGLQKPVIVHTRKAERLVLDLLIEEKAEKVVLHCFSGSAELIKEGAKAGFSFSIPTNVVFSEHFQRLVRLCPLQQLLTETDAPYLGPAKGQRNEPANIAVSIKKIAELKDLDAGEMKNIVFENYQRMFL
ncbi:MAG: TatD family hydrolase [Nanoarchaeota archaeon]